MESPKRTREDRLDLNEEASARTHRRSTAITCLLAVLAFTLVTVSAVPSGGAQPAQQPDSHEDHDHPHEGEPFEASAARKVDRYGMDRAFPGVSVERPEELDDCVFHTRTLNGGTTFRERFGLAPLARQSDAVVERFGHLVTAQDAIAIDKSAAAYEAVAPNMEEIAAGSKIQPVTLALHDSLSSPSFFGLRWDPDSGQLIAYVNSDSAKRDAQTVLENDFPTLSILVLKTGGPSAQVVRDQQAELTASIERDGQLEGSIGSSLDITCGKVLVIVSNETDRRMVERLVPDKSNFAVIVAPELSNTPADRYNHHHADQDGGLGIRAWNEGTSTYEGMCTSSIPLQLGETQYAVTAGHCLGASNLISGVVMRFSCQIVMRQSSVSLHSGNWCVRYQLGARVDAAAVLKYNWEPGSTQTFINGATHAQAAMGWWHWDRNLVPTGSEFCQSGRNWAGAPCGELTGLDYDECYPASASWPLYCVTDLPDTDMPVIGGDSGATVWHRDYQNGLWYAGIVHATGGQFVHLQDLRASLGLGAPVGMF